MLKKNWNKKKRSASTIKRKRKLDENSHPPPLFLKRVYTKRHFFIFFTFVFTSIYFAGFKESVEPNPSLLEVRLQDPKATTPRRTKDLQDLQNQFSPRYEHPFFKSNSHRESPSDIDGKYSQAQYQAGKHRIAIINTMHAPELSNTLLNSLETFSANDGILDYFLFANNASETYKRQINDRIPDATNIFVIGEYFDPQTGIYYDPKSDNQSSDMIAFVQQQFLLLLESAGVDPLPELNYQLKYKLCDVRPLFGDIFRAWVHPYTYWAWADQHTYAADLEPYIKDWLGTFDVITFAPPSGGGWRMYTSGRLSLFRNDLPFVRSYWKLTDHSVMFQKFHQDGKGRYSDEWWFSMPVFQHSNISFMQTYVQSEDSEKTLWHRKCDESNKCTNHFYWKYTRLKRYWYEDTMNMTEPEHLDPRFEISHFLQPWHDPSNLDMEGIAGFYNFYRLDGKWFRKPIDKSLFIEYNDRLNILLLKPMIVHSRKLLCNVQENEIPHMMQYAKPYKWEMYNRTNDTYYCKGFD